MEINVLTDAAPTVITAQARQVSEDTGFSFVHCSVGGKGWMEAPRVVFAYTSMSGVVNPEGWSSNNHPSEKSRLCLENIKTHDQVLLQMDVLNTTNN
ncbi:hypothetical protein RCOM_1502780 [Ricinus communis]|uniref:Pectinesterase n=1 Tax=Ricinus communis TaxID=3988 RepID=B9RA14_RICCO|nr:hypothetical protein RCOM_1502780 [Ricinus communis]